MFVRVRVSSTIFWLFLIKNIFKFKKKHIWNYVLFFTNKWIPVFWQKILCIFNDARTNRFIKPIIKMRLINKVSGILYKCCKSVKYAKYYIYLFVDIKKSVCGGRHGFDLYSNLKFYLEFTIDIKLKTKEVKLCLKPGQPRGLQLIILM